MKSTYFIFLKTDFAYAKMKFKKNYIEEIISVHRNTY